MERTKTGVNEASPGEIANEAGNLKYTDAFECKPMGYSLSPPPSMGRIVTYNTTKEDREFMGSSASQLPAIIVSVEEKGINLQVFMEGPGTLWKTSIKTGNEEGQWQWPVRI